ncbi:MAG: dockerin type I domain-containing protein, partial [Planctomycetota bacterium]
VIDNLGASVPSAANVDGDGDVDVIDRIIVSGRLGNQINPDLPITDPETLGEPRITDFDVNRNQDQRSFLRYIDTELSSDAVAAEIAASLGDGDASNDRIELRRYELDGSGDGEVIDLADYLAATDRVLRIDFGSGGVGGNGNSTDADGYYALGLDIDGDGTFDNIRNFHRLLGDVTGDGRVNVLDRITVELGLRFGDNPEADANGDGRVNVIDRIRVEQNLTRSINGDLKRDD